MGLLPATTNNFSTWSKGNAQTKCGLSDVTPTSWGILYRILAGFEAAGRTSRLSTELSDPESLGK